MNQVVPGVNAYEPIGSRVDFGSKICSLSLPVLAVTTTVIPPSYIDRKMTEYALLNLPVSGQFDVTIDGRHHQCGVGLDGMFFPQKSGHFQGVGSNRNLFTLKFEPGLLEKTARAMLGLPGNAELDWPSENSSAVAQCSG